MVVSIVMVGTCQLWVPRWCTAKCIYACTYGRQCSEPACVPTHTQTRAHTYTGPKLELRNVRYTFAHTYTYYVRTYVCTRVQASRRGVSHRRHRSEKKPGRAIYVIPDIGFSNVGAICAFGAHAFQFTNGSFAPAICFQAATLSSCDNAQRFFTFLLARNKAPSTVTGLLRYIC